MKDTSIIIGMAAVAVVIGVVIFLNGGGSSIANTGQSAEANIQPSAIVVPFTELAHGTNSTVTKRTNYLVTSTDEFKKLWKMVDATGTPPAVDFSTQNVIAVFAGKESTSSIAIAKIEDTNARMVSISITKPDSICSVRPSVVSPYEIVIVLATSLPLAHADLSTIASCPK